MDADIPPDNFEDRKSKVASTGLFGTLGAAHQKRLFAKTLDASAVCGRDANSWQAEPPEHTKRPPSCRQTTEMDCRHRLHEVHDETRHSIQHESGTTSIGVPVRSSKK